MSGWSKDEIWKVTTEDVERKCQKTSVREEITWRKRKTFPITSRYFIELKEELLAIDKETINTTKKKKKKIELIKTQVRIRKFYAKLYL